jgi:hypothetical protein
VIDVAFTVATLVGGWAAFWWFREFRTIRTVALLSVSTAVLLLSWGLPQPGPLLISITVAAVLLVIHFRFNRWIAAHSPAEQAFVDRLLSINERLGERYESAAIRGDSEPLRDAIVIAAAEVERLVTPGPDWEQVKVLALALLRERLQLLDSRDASPKARMLFRSHRAALHEQLRLAQAKTAKFWR